LQNSLNWEATYNGIAERFGLPQRIVDLFGRNQAGKPHTHKVFHVTMRRADDYQEGAIELFLSDTEAAIEKDDFMLRLKSTP
jgi:hypothetical protein